MVAAELGTLHFPGIPSGDQYTVIFTMLFNPLMTLIMLCTHGFANWEAQETLMHIKSQ